MNVTLSGTLTHGEDCGGCGSQADTTYGLGLGACGSKLAAVGLGTGPAKRTVSSPSAFVALEGAGTTVTRCDFLYLHSNADVTLRLTTDDGSGGSVVVELPHVGLLIKEFPASKFLKLVEVKGSAQVSYLVTGPS